MTGTEDEEDEVEIKVERDGTVRFFRDGELHRDDGPALIQPGPYGTEFQFWQFGVLHRDDGPAVVRFGPNGREEWWFQFGKKHREDGPAIVQSNGSQEWFRDGKVHREDGPAVIGADGSKRYYLNGEPWDDGASVIARRKAEAAKARKMKPPIKPQ